MKKTKVYDCSNSIERPPHRSESCGPKENDIMRGLKKHAHLFNCEFIDQPNDAEVIITNDVFPKEILALNKPRVKRMDGVYWDKNKDRNESLNNAAMKACWVIFISNYSRLSLKILYNIQPRSNMVIPNCVDESVYFPFSKNCRHITWVASASNWAREEKRFDDLMVFSKKVMHEEDRLFLIGKCEKHVNKKVNSFGYIDNEAEVNEILNMGDAFINLSYRDAAPKVVCQAVNCKLPVLFANSGGTCEMVNSGVGINDKDDIVFEDSVPRLKIEDMVDSYKKFRNNHSGLIKKAWKRRDFGYMEMLGCYFSVMNYAISDFIFHGGKNYEQRKIAENN